MEKHDGTGIPIITNANKGNNAPFRYVGTAPLEKKWVRNLPVYRDDGQGIAVYTGTGQERRITGYLIDDSLFKEYQRHLEPCSFEEGEDVRYWRRMPGSAVVYSDHITGAVAKYKGFSIANDNKHKPTAKVLGDLVHYWYLKRGGDVIIEKKHTLANKDL